MRKLNLNQPSVSIKPEMEKMLLNTIIGLSSPKCNPSSRQADVKEAEHGKSNTTVIAPVENLSTASSLIADIEKFIGDFINNATTEDMDDFYDMLVEYADGDGDNCYEILCRKADEALKLIQTSLSLIINDTQLRRMLETHTVTACRKLDDKSISFTLTKK